jgi:CD109 antigen
LLNFNRKSSSVFIQTDKALYKPGDNVQFRILVVDGNTRPLDLSKNSVKVWIIDSNSNKIKEWKDVKITNGVFKSELKLSREPAFGNWTLKLNCSRNNEYNQSIVSLYLCSPQILFFQFSVKIDDFRSR